MNKIKLALVAAVGFLFLACGSKADKTDVDFSLIPIKGANGEYQYIDMKQNGKIAINPQFGEAHFFRDGLALVKISGKDGKWGYIDKEGKYAIAPTYSVAQDFSEGVAWVQMEDQPPMLIDKEGKMLLQIDSLERALPFVDGMSLISVWSQGKTLNMLIDRNGQSITTTEDWISGVNEGFYAFRDKETGKWGFKSINGETVINPQFDNIEPFFEGIASVQSGEKWGAIDNKGSFVINPQYDSLGYDKDGLFLAKVGKKWGLVNKKNEFVINPQYDAVGGFGGDKLSLVQMGGKFGFIDKKGQVAINPQFDIAMPFSGNYAMVTSGGKIGFINHKGEYIIQPLHDVDNDFLKYVGDYTSALFQKIYNIPMQYINLPYSFGLNLGWFPYYAKLNEKIEALREMEREKARKKLEEVGDERDGKKYKSVKIGDQVWMARNLNFNASGSKCYEDKPENCDKYGRLYNWNTAKQVCPQGWHLPNNAEWRKLVDFAGGKNAAGKKLKAKSGWSDKYGKSGNGTDTYGFAALPGGSYSYGKFNYVGDIGEWWSASDECYPKCAYIYNMFNSNEGVSTFYYSKDFLFSVRCVQN